MKRLNLEAYREHYKNLASSKSYADVLALAGDTALITSANVHLDNYDRCRGNLKDILKVLDVVFTEIKRREDAKDTKTVSLGALYRRYNEDKHKHV